MTSFLTMCVTSSITVLWAGHLGFSASTVSYFSPPPPTAPPLATLQLGIDLQTPALPMAILKETEVELRRELCHQSPDHNSDLRLSTRSQLVPANRVQLRLRGFCLRLPPLLQRPAA